MHLCRENFGVKKSTLRVGQSVIGRGLVPNLIIGGRVLRVSHGEEISGKYGEPMGGCIWGAMEMHMC